MEKITKSDAEWRAQLTPEQYHVAREHGTEAAFTGPYWDHHQPGLYRCVACGLELFAGADKFDSGTGWPSFTRPLAPDRVELSEDRSLGMVRTEVHCPRCGSHLGHLFADGPPPLATRYCINSASLDFTPAE